MTEHEATKDGSSRRDFLRKLGLAGAVMTPVVASFGLIGCEEFPGGGGSNVTLPPWFTIPGGGSNVSG